MASSAPADNSKEQPVVNQETTTEKLKSGTESQPLSKGNKKKSDEPGLGGPSILNVFLLYLTLLGLGGIGGYVSFYFVFSERCMELMEETELRHNSSRALVQKKYEEALEDRKQCIVNTNNKDEVKELQGRLEAQSHLAERHQNLLNRHEDSLHRLSSIQAAHEVSTQTVVNLREQLSETRLRLEQIRREYRDLVSEKNTMEKQMKDKLMWAESSLDDRMTEIEELQEYRNQCRKSLPSLQDESSRMKNYLKQRHHQSCKMEYGRGPFHVEFTLKFPPTMGPNEEPNTFVIRTVSLADMPHTVHTFLDLVDLQVFDGTAFVAANSSHIEGGSPNHAETSRSLKLHERYAKFGYSRSALAFQEYSPRQPHQELTIGFVVRGPTLMINMADNTLRRGPSKERNPDPCFGTVVKGLETLTRIQSAAKSADGYRLALKVQILTARLLKQAPE